MSTTIHRVKHESRWLGLIPPLPLVSCDLTSELLFAYLSDAGRDWGKRRRGRQRMRWLDGIIDSMDVSLSELWGVGDGQGGLACCDSWGRKESDTTERLN